jgi:hypothetical protein
MPRTVTGVRIAALLGLAGVGYRLAMLLIGAPPTNSDEGTMGLAALHVLQGRELPVFFYGQHYMGTLEAYLAAPLIAAFGAGTVVLRLPLLLIYAAFLVCMYRLTRRVYSPGLAVVTVGLLALGSDRILKNQLIAAGGYPEINLAGAVLFLLAAGLALDPPGPAGSGVRGRQLAAVGAWGFVAGLCLWVDWLVLPYLAASAVVLAVALGRHLLGRAGLVLAGTLLLGALPAVIYNLTAAPGEDSLSVFFRLRSGPPVPMGERLHGGVLFGVPMGTGLCPPSRCEPAQLWWGAAYPVLLILAAVLAARGLRARAAATGTGAATAASRVELVRFALVMAAALSLLSYTTSAAAGQTPVESARYLSCLLISTPAVLWPVWRALTHRVAARPRPPVLRWMVSFLVIALLAGSAVFATGALLADAPRIARVRAKQAELTRVLHERGATRIYSDYWTCDRTIFATREQVACAVLNDDLSPGLDRYRPYRVLVGRASRPSYVLLADSPLDRHFRALLDHQRMQVTPVEAAGYRIYVPPGPVLTPQP